MSKNKLILDSIQILNEPNQRARLQFIIFAPFFPKVGPILFPYILYLRGYPFGIGLRSLEEKEGAIRALIDYVKICPVYSKVYFKHTACGPQRKP